MLGSIQARSGAGCHNRNRPAYGAAPLRPTGFPASIEGLLTRHSWEEIDAYCRGILDCLGVSFAEADAIWPTRFMRDTELRWMTEEPAIDDL